MTSPIEFRQMVQMHFRGGILIDCTKSTSLENEQLLMYLMDELKMKRAVVLDCDDFPSTVRLSHGETDYPLQICSALGSKILILTSNFVVAVMHERQLARGLVAWARKQSLALIITLFSQNTLTGKKLPPARESDVAAICLRTRNKGFATAGLS
jgi:predicted ATP-grasp superfamily ATP-dependent carboligase